MEKQYSVKFFSSFIESLQNICQEHLTFDQVVEVSGYVSVEIDNSQKERYVLSEFLQACGNILSESYCTKVYKNLPVNVRERNKSGGIAADEDKENSKVFEQENSDGKGSKSSGATFVSLFDNSQNPKRINSNKSTEPRVSLLTEEPELKKAKHTARKSMASSSNKLPKSSCSVEIESRSSSFLASSAKWMSTCSEKSPPRTESFQDFVSGVVDSLGSPKPDSSNSDEETMTQVHFATNPVLSKSLSQDSSTQSQLPSTNPSSSRLPISLPSLFKFKSKQPKSSKKSSSFKASINKSKPSLTSSLSNEARSSCSKPKDLIPVDMNVSSLRHLVSKSYEDSAALEQRQVGGTEDILPGQAYIELVEDGRDKEDKDGEDGGVAIISLDDLPGEAEAPDLPAQTNSQSPGADVPCTVSSSLMLDAGSISTLTSVDDADSCQFAISEDEVDDPCNLDSPIIIELDSDEEEDHECDSEPYAIKELRTLDTFKDYVKFAVRRFQAFTKEKGISEPIFRIPTTKLDPLLAEFYVTVRNKRGEDFGTSTLKSIPSYLELYLRENGYPVSITRDTEFSNCRSILQTKIRQIQEVQHILTRRDVDRMFRADQILSDSNVRTLTNSMWLMNTLLFKVRKDDHCLLKWGDVTLKRDEYQSQYLELSRSAKTTPCDKIYPNNADPDRCFVKMYKLFERRRPENSLSPMAPFYLAVDEHSDVLKNEKMESRDINAILRNMLLKSGIPPDKQIVDYDIL